MNVGGLEDDWSACFLWTPREMGEVLNSGVEFSKVAADLRSVDSRT